MSQVSTPTSQLRINGSRLWDSLMRLAQIGATPKGGVARLALTDLDRQGRDKIPNRQEVGQRCRGRFGRNLHVAVVDAHLTGRAKGGQGWSVRRRDRPVRAQQESS